MVKPTHQFIAQMFAAAGVIISMGFVAYELKQSRDIAIAELNLEQSYASADFYLSLTDADAWRSSQTKLMGSAEEFDMEERLAVLTAYAHTQMLRHNNWILNELGFGREGEWSAVEEEIKKDMADPIYFEYWTIAFGRTGGPPAWRQRLRELWVEVHGELPPEE